MFTQGGRRLRAFRPSRLSNEDGEEVVAMRLENVEKYMKRASLGLPIFEEAPATATMERRSNRLH